MTIWPLNHLIEVVKVARADRLFEPGRPPDASTRATIGPVIARNHDALAGRALAVAISQLGRGEEGKNNQGDDVAKYLAPSKPPLFWCAGFAGWCYEEAARGLGRDLPFTRSLGAKTLGRNVAAVGRRFMAAGEADPGDLLVLHRHDGTGSVKGHVAIVDSHPSKLVLNVIEGNKGRFPSVVKRSTYNPETMPLAFFASLRR